MKSKSELVGNAVVVVVAAAVFWRIWGDHIRQAMPFADQVATSTHDTESQHESDSSSPEIISPIATFQSEGLPKAYGVDIEFTYPSLWTIYPSVGGDNVALIEAPDSETPGNVLKQIAIEVQPHKRARSAGEIGLYLQPSVWQAHQPPGISIERPFRRNILGYKAMECTIRGVAP